MNSFASRTSPMPAPETTSDSRAGLVASPPCGTTGEYFLRTATSMDELFRDEISRPEEPGEQRHALLAMAPSEVLIEAHVDLDLVPRSPARSPATCLSPSQSRRTQPSPSPPANAGLPPAPKAEPEPTKSQTNTKHGVATTLDDDEL